MLSSFTDEHFQRWLKCGSVDLRLLCFCIRGHCFCPENLKWNHNRRRVSQSVVQSFSRCWLTVSDTVSFTHNAVGDLPGIMQEAEISPLQRLARHFVGQFVSERWRETER